MTDIVKLKQDGLQVYPQTHEQAIIGLSDAIDKKMTEAGTGAVSSVNGKTGVVTLTATDVKALPNTTVIPTIPGVATTSTNGLMSSTDKSKLNGIPVISFEKVGTV